MFRVLTTVEIPKSSIIDYVVRPNVLASTLPFPQLTVSEREALAWVQVHDFDLVGDPERITETLAHFGRINTVCEKLVQPTNGCMNGIWAGVWRVGVAVKKPIPYNAIIDGKRVRFMYRQQVRRCGHCGLTQSEGCRFEARTKDCYEGGAEKADLGLIWHILFSRAKGEICPEDKVLRQKQEQLEAAYAEMDEDQQRLTGPPALNPSEFFDFPPIVPSEYLADTDVDEMNTGQGGQAGQLRKKKKKKTQSNSGDPEVKANQSDVIELFDLPVNKARITPENIREWLRRNEFEEFRRSGDAGVEAWKICNVPNRRKSWLVAGLDLEERIRIYKLEDRKIAGFNAKIRPYTIEAALRDEVTGATFESGKEEEERMIKEVEMARENEKREKEMAAVAEREEKGTEGGDESGESEEEEEEDVGWCSCYFFLRAIGLVCVVALIAGLIILSVYGR